MKGSSLGGNSSGVVQLDDYEVREENLPFAYHALNAVHDVVEEYWLMSGGVHLFDAGIEAHMSGFLAQRLFSSQVSLYVPVQDVELGDRKRQLVPVDHVLLEAGRDSVFGESGSKQRMDVGLGTRSFANNEPRAPIEIFFGIELKRHLTEIEKDIAKLVSILQLHRDENWCMHAGAIIAFAETDDKSHKDVQNRLSDRLRKFSRDYSGLEMEACWMVRDGIQNYSGGVDWMANTQEYDKTKELAACCIFLSLNDEN